MSQEQLLTQLQDKIEASIKGFKLPNNPIGLNEPIEYILSIGGKRIRPLLVMLANHLFNGDDNQAVRPALAIELFHNFTLMHDDIMDEAPLRRGKETVHKKFDVNTAILSGDVMLIYAYQLLEDLGAEKFQRIFSVFNAAAVKVCEGQQYDMNYEEDKEVSIAEYIKMIELKTAVLLGCSLQVGAILGSASIEDDQRLYEFGKNIGIAFQLQDDILDVYGGASFGKQAGGDIIQNKKTFLLLSAIEKAEGKDRNDLLDWIAKKDFDSKQKVEAVTALYNKLGIKELAQSEMKKYNQKAFDYLAQLELENKAPLEYIANKLLKRSV